jgi:NifU-like protein
MLIDFQVSDGRLVRVRAEAFGCGAAVAAASAATELLEGRTLSAARALTAFELDRALGGVPAPKRHALWMVLECVADALGSRTEPDATRGGPTSQR